MTYQPPEQGPYRPEQPPADPFSSPPGWDQPYGPPPDQSYGAPPGGQPPYGSGNPSYGQGQQPPPGPPPSAPTSPYGPGGPPPSAPTSPYGPPPGQPYGTTQPYGAFGSPPPGSPPGPPMGPPGPPMGPPYQSGPGQPPKRRRGLLIAGIALVAVLVLCGGGGVGAVLLLRDTDTGGADSPTAAVQEFLYAVYRDLDPARASAMVCSEARDEEALAAKIDEIAGYESQHVEPRFTWTNPQVVDEQEDSATVATTVSMVTGDEKVSDLEMRVTVLDKGSNGWWVCDLESSEADPDAPSAPDGAEPEGEAESDGDASEDESTDEG